MTDDEIIHILEVNRDHNKDRQKFVEAINKSITAIIENRQLKNRCYVLSNCGGLCVFL